VKSAPAYHFDLRIDRLRGWFAILVLLGHAFDVAVPYARLLPGRLDFGLNIVASARGFLGFLWVIGFLVLSGYCIARSCERQGERFAFGRYALMRVSRLYPLMITAALFTLAIETIMAGSALRPPIWRLTDIAPTTGLGFALLGLSGFGQYGSMAPSYTITYELIYYGIWGLIWLAFRRSRLMVTVACCASLLALYFVLVPGVAQLCAVIYVCWLIGAALWMYRRELEPLARRIPESVAWLVLVVTAVAVAIYNDYGIGHPPLTEASLGAILQFAVLGLAFAVVVASYTAKPMWLSLTTAFDRWLGDISYPLFMAHGPVIIFTGFLINWSGLQTTFTVHLLIQCVVALVAAHLMMVLVDRPLAAWRRYSFSRRVTAA
jgi:peptidoglycan/LPS O-acetylase OafA/YrhL